jgi:DNA polymerase-3 subunit beta
VKLSTKKSDLVRALATVRGAADRKGSNPQLGNALLTTFGDRLHVTATDLYVGVATAIPADVRAPGSVSISAQRLFDAAKNLPDGDVSIEVDGIGAVIKSGKSRFKLPTLPGEDFPMLPAAPDDVALTIESAVLAEMLGTIRHAVTDGNARPHLEGALFQVDGGAFRIVATDGHRLSLVESAAEARDFKVFIPFRGVGELARFADGKGSVAIGIGDGAVFFSRDSSTLHTKIADDQFPPYARVVPQNQSKRIVVARTPLLDATRRAMVVVGASGKSEGCQLRISDGAIGISRVDPDAGEFSDELAVDYAGKDVTIGLSLRYLAESLAALTHDEIAIHAEGELDPITIRPVGGDLAVTLVVMPMRLT